MPKILMAIWPIFLLIAMGWTLRRCTNLGPGWRSGAERLTYYLLLPCLIVTKLAQADFSLIAVVPMVVAIALAIVLLTILLLAIRPWLSPDGRRFSSVYQGAVRMNTYLGLSIAGAMYGAAGMEAAALAVGTIVPLVNVTCVLTLATFANSATSSYRRIFVLFITNPLILACVIGGVLNASGCGLPVVIGPLAKLLARPALPLGLLLVGAALDFKALKGEWSLVMLTAALKLLVLPSLTWGLLRALDVTGVAAAVALVFNSLPPAPSAYILARQLGGDATLMATLVTSQTLFASVSLPIWLWLLART